MPHDIIRKYKTVKTSASGLMGKLKHLLHASSMMSVKDDSTFITKYT